MGEIVIRAEHLGKQYDLGKAKPEAGTRPESFVPRMWKSVTHHEAREVQSFWALNDVCFEVEKGETIGIVGNNGAGKSTLLKILSRITEPTRGKIEIHGRTGALLEVGTGFHGELTGRENIFLNGVIIGMKKADIRRKFDEIVEFAGIEEFLDTPVKRYSSGMYMRLAFSVAAHLDPDILIVDEVLAVGDAAFQKKCLGKLQDLAAGSQRTVLFVSHNLQAVQSLCGRVMHFEHGRLAAFGEARSVVRKYLTESTSHASSQQWDGDAPGNREVRLKRISVKSGRQLNGIYSSSQTVAVEMDLETTGALDTLDIGFDLMTAEGVEVLSALRPRSDDTVVGSPQAGLRRVRCVLPAGLLNAGVYQVSPWVRDGGNHWIINQDTSVSFEIILDHGVSAYWNSLDASSRPGLIAPILDWKTAPAEKNAYGSAGVQR